MKFNPFRKRGKPPQPSMPTETEAPTSFEGDIFDPVTFRYHALRILCGALMDRRALCPFPHPFCGPSHQEYGDIPIQLIAHANIGTDDTETMQFVDMFLCRATFTTSEGLEVDDYVDMASRLRCADEVPRNKILARPAIGGGIYPAGCGPLLKGSPADHFQGEMDISEGVAYLCDPEPGHCEWEYWHTPRPETLLWEGPPWATYVCMQVFGEWYIFDPDYRLPEPRWAARLQLADSPNHFSEGHRIGPGSRYHSAIGLPPS